MGSSRRPSSERCGYAINVQKEDPPCRKIIGSMFMACGTEKDWGMCCAYGLHNRATY